MTSWLLAKFSNTGPQCRPRTLQYRACCSNLQHVRAEKREHRIVHTWFVLFIAVGCLHVFAALPVYVFKAWRASQQQALRDCPKQLTQSACGYHAELSDSLATAPCFFQLWALFWPELPLISYPLSNQNPAEAADRHRCCLSYRRRAQVALWRPC